MENIIQSYWRLDNIHQLSTCRMRLLRLWSQRLSENSNFAQNSKEKSPDPPSEERGDRSFARSQVARSQAPAWERRRGSSSFPCVLSIRWYPQVRRSWSFQARRFPSQSLGTSFTGNLVIARRSHHVKLDPVLLRLVLRRLSHPPLRVEKDERCLLIHDKRC